MYAEEKAIEAYLTAKKLSFTKVDGVYHAQTTLTYNYQIAPGDTVDFNFVGHTIASTAYVFDTNIKSEAIMAKLDTASRTFNPIRVIAGSGTLIRGLDLGLMQACDQEKGIIVFPSYLGFGKRAIGPLEPWTPLAYSIHILHVNGKAIEQEKAYINSLNLPGEGFSPHGTSGLFYKITQQVSVNYKPTLDSTIYGWYRGTLPSGELVHQTLGDNQLIKLSASTLPIGLRLGYTLLNEGEAASIVLPSYLGYGIEGNEVVGPYQTLFYQIRLDSIKRIK
jgi:FKBP-type peptidyl-prolyl cis-trans isomerase